MRQDLLKSVLDKLNAASADIDASAIISSDGLIFASSLPGEQLDQDRVSALSAALLSIGVRLATELGCGALQQLMLKSELVYVIAMQTRPETVLIAVLKPTAKPGLAVIDVLRAAEAAELIMK